MDDLDDVVASADVDVEVGDVDDNFPVFVQDLYYFDYVPMKVRV